MNKIKFLIILFSLVLINPGNALEDEIIAIVNDSVVLKSELNNKLAAIKLEGVSRLEVAKLKRNILDQLIEESLLEQAASRLGIYISDIDLQNRIKFIAQNQNLTVLQLKEAVEAQNMSYLKYLKNLKKRIQIEELFRTQFTARAYVSEEEIQSYLKNNDGIESIDNIVSVREYLIEDESDELDVSKVKILVNSIKANGLEDTKIRYPNLKINISDLNENQGNNSLGSHDTVGLRQTLKDFHTHPDMNLTEMERIENIIGAVKTDKKQIIEESLNQEEKRKMKITLSRKKAYDQVKALGKNISKSPERSSNSNDYGQIDDHLNGINNGSDSTEEARGGGWLSGMASSINKTNHMSNASRSSKGMYQSKSTPMLRPTTLNENDVSLTPQVKFPPVVHRRAAESDTKKKKIVTNGGK